MTIRQVGDSHHRGIAFARFARGSREKIRTMVQPANDGWFRHAASASTPASRLRRACSRNLESRKSIIATGERICLRSHDPLDIKAVACASPPIAVGMNLKQHLRQRAEPRTCVLSLIIRYPRRAIDLRGETLGNAILSHRRLYPAAKTQLSAMILGDGVDNSFRSHYPVKIQMSDR